MASDNTKELLSKLNALFSKYPEDKDFYKKREITFEKEEDLDEDVLKLTIEEIQLRHQEKGLGFDLDDLTNEIKPTGSYNQNLNKGINGTTDKESKSGKKMSKTKGNRHKRNNIDQRIIIQDNANSNDFDTFLNSLNDLGAIVYSSNDASLKPNYDTIIDETIEQCFSGLYKKNKKINNNFYANKGKEISELIEQSKEQPKIEFSDNGEDDNNYEDN